MASSSSPPRHRRPTLGCRTTSFACWDTVRISEKRRQSSSTVHSPLPDDEGDQQAEVCSTVEFLTRRSVSFAACKKSGSSVLLEPLLPVGCDRSGTLRHRVLDLARGRKLRTPSLCRRRRSFHRLCEWALGRSRPLSHARQNL